MIFSIFAICISIKLNRSSHWCLQLWSSTMEFILAFSSCLSVSSFSNSKKTSTHYPKLRSLRSGGRENLPLVAVQSLSCVWLFATPQTAAHQASLSFIISQGLLKLSSVESMTPSNVPLSSCLQSFPAPESFPMSWLFTSDGQSIRASASALQGRFLQGSIHGSGRSPEGGNGNPLQYSCLGNPMDRGAWLAAVHSVPVCEKFHSFSNFQLFNTVFWWQSPSYTFSP